MLIIAAILISLLAIHVDWSQGQDDKTYNFVFAVQWGIGACVQYAKNTSLQVCLERADKDKKWTIHGLWPDEVKSWTKPETTTITPIVGELLEEMNVSWPDVAKMDNTKFWSYEYGKHGATAVKNIPWITTQDQYFRLALTLFNGLQFHNGNNFGNCEPRLDRYSILDLEQCMESVGFQRYTYRLKSTKAQHILYEIQICYEISGLNLTDAKSSLCNEYKDMMYPNSKGCVQERKRRSAEDEICSLFLESEYTADTETESTTSAAGSSLVDLCIAVAAAVFVMAVVDGL